MKTDNQIIQDAAIQIASHLALTALQNSSTGRREVAFNETEYKTIAKTAVDLAKQLAIELRSQRINA